MIANINMVFQAAAGTQRVYFRLVNTAATGYVPTSAEKITLTAGVIQD